MEREDEREKARKREGNNDRTREEIGQMFRI